MFNNPDFYPTPSAVANIMLQKLDVSSSDNFLEPSAGRGDLATAILNRFSGYGKQRPKIDCIESDPDLVSILQAKGLPVVGYDFLTYSGVSYYDAIVMNPPFSNGVEHLLKAWDFLYEGEIVCLLNANSITNPHTEQRRRLAGIIQTYGSVSMLGQCFTTASRQSDVEVALVYLKKIAPAEDLGDLWKREGEEPVLDLSGSAEDAMLAVRDELGNLEHYYNQVNTEVTAAMRHLRRASFYLDAMGINVSKGDLKQCLDRAWRNRNQAAAEFVRMFRKASWTKVFSMMQFHEWLDTAQTEAMLRDVEQNCHAQFCAENIKGTLENILLQRKKLFEQSCALVFDQLTMYHKANTCYHEGWKSNENYKINQKLVFPYGIRQCEYMETFHLDHQPHFNILLDLDRVVAVLDGLRLSEIITIRAALDNRFLTLGRVAVNQAFNNHVESTYFEIKFFKKGTLHIKFKSQILLDKLNATASAGKRWIGANTKGESA